MWFILYSAKDLFSKYENQYIRVITVGNYQYGQFSKFFGHAFVPYLAAFDAFVSAAMFSRSAMGSEYRAGQCRKLEG